tara:strand:- start:2799 stop:4100 length:1302 start_codon:yes stop_codon:yes gene_type:complete
MKWYHNTRPSKLFDIWDCEETIFKGVGSGVICNKYAGPIDNYSAETFRAFLPQGDPLERLHSPVDGFWDQIEDLAAEMPTLLEERKWRHEVVARLRPLREHEHTYNSRRMGGDIIDTGHKLERAMLLYSYFASAYVHATYENSAKLIPKEIAVPFVTLAERCGRPPILSYASYCLTNWKKSKYELSLDTLELLQNFTPTHKQDEDWFILVHVEIESKFQPAFAYIGRSRGHYRDEAVPAIEHCLDQVGECLVQMNKTMDRMPENCSPDFYFDRVRPYIFGFEDVVYEGCFDNKPITLRGETGAQSSIVPLLVQFLGVEHKDSKLTSHLEDMKKYMPPQHRFYLADWEGYNKAALNNDKGWEFPCTTRQFVQRHTQLKDSYNHCLEGLLMFRIRHLEYAINYIQKKVRNPKGTGGTPFIPWLSQLKEETEAQML